MEIPPRRVYDAMITSSLHQNDVTTSFWCNNDVIIPSCVRWECVLSRTSGDKMTQALRPSEAIYLGQHWLRWWPVAWWHQGIGWTNVDLSPVRYSDIHRRLPKIKISETRLKFAFFKIASMATTGQWVHELRDTARNSKLGGFETKRIPLSKPFGQHLIDTSLTRNARVNIFA